MITRRTTLLALAVVLALPALAHAEDQIDVQILVAQVSKKGAEVAPELKGMSTDLKRTGLAFTNYKLVNKHSLKLKLNQPGQVSLPNNAVAKLTLIKLEGAKATVKVDSPALKMDMAMTPGGEIYIGAGKADPKSDDQIYLAVKR
ncbi:MAG: hypothetical protein QM765_10530 [Myxococcales bacterium]